MPGSCAQSSAPIAAPNLTIAKAAPVPALEIGAQSTYVLTVTNNGSSTATTAQVKDQLPTELSFVSAAGIGWTCTNASGLITCNFSGTIAASSTSTINVVVTAATSAPGKTVTNYASVDPTGGGNAPAPSPSCTPSTSCASVSSTVGASKRRTEAIIHNYLAKRGERIVSNGLDLHRLYTSAAGTYIDGQKISIDRLIFGPEVRYRTELSDKSALGFHVGVKGLWDFNPIGLRNLDEPTEIEKRSNLHVRFDVGATLYSTSGMSLEVNLGYEGLGHDQYSAKSITGRLRIPLQ